MFSKKHVKNIKKKFSLFGEKNSDSSANIENWNEDNANVNKSNDALIIEKPIFNENYDKIMQALEFENNADIRKETMKFVAYIDMLNLRAVNKNWSKVVNNMLNNIEQKIEVIKLYRKDMEGLMKQPLFRDKYMVISDAVEGKFLPFIWHVKPEEKFNSRLADTIIKILEGPNALSTQEKHNLINHNHQQVTNSSMNKTINELKKCLYRADFSNKNLSNLDLANADLSNSNMSYSNISGTNLKGADMTGTNLKGVIITFDQLMSLKSFENAKIDFYANTYTEKQMEAINKGLKPVTEVKQEMKHGLRRNT